MNDKTLSNKQQKKQPIWKSTLAILLFVVICILQWIAMELSATTWEVVIGRVFFRNLISFSIILFLNAILLFLLGTSFVTQICTSLLCTLIAVVNAYVLKLHGSPLRLSELRSVFTAVNVIGGYQLSLLPKVRYIILFFLLEVSLLVLVIKQDLQLRRIYAHCAGLLFVGLSLGVLLFGFSSSDWRPIIGWSLQVATNSYGYPAVLVEDSYRFFSRYSLPAGYTDDALDIISTSWSNRNDTEIIPEDRPDIILILNETFYDPAVCTSLEVQVDRPYLSSFYSFQNVARGFNAVPTTGTNGTEYELLTSNSSVLINPSAPFNYFPLLDANSIIRYMKSLGYRTWAFHNAEPENYSRVSAYPALGFDHVAFYQHFQPEVYYGKRRATDSHDYEKLIEAYEKADDDPRFIYMLTIQNHGGWEQNTEEYDTVHVKGDYGNLTDDYNEFLTSISMSDAALQELIDYFLTIDRHVIVVMTGDHPPAFLSEARSKLDDEKEIILANMTPYIIWSNYQDISTEYPYITGSDLVPMTLKIAGLPLSPYYRQILDLQAKLPVHEEGAFLNTEGKLYSDITGLDGENELHDYLIMECNNLQSVDKRRQELFDP